MKWQPGWSNLSIPLVDRYRTDQDASERISNCTTTQFGRDPQECLSEIDRVARVEPKMVARLAPLRLRQDPAINARHTRINPLIHSTRSKTMAARLREQIQAAAACYKK